MRHVPTLDRAKRKSKARARKFPMLGNSVTDRLYRAVANYVDKEGGNLLVVGGIQIQRWPGESKHAFRVAVHCMGTAPAFESEKK